MRVASHHYTDTIDGLKIDWMDGCEGTGRKITAIYTGTEAAPKRLDRKGQSIAASMDGIEPKGLIVLGTHKWDRPTIREAMDILPEYADKIYEVSFISVPYRPYLGTVDVSDILEITPSTVRRIIAADPEGCFKNSSGWQITWEALAQLRHRPKPGPKKKLTKSNAD